MACSYQDQVQIRGFSEVDTIKFQVRECSLYKLHHQNSLFSFKMTNISEKKYHFLDCTEFLRSNGTGVAKGRLNFNEQRTGFSQTKRYFLHHFVK